MRSRIPDKNIWLVYGAIFLLGLAYGIAISLLSIFLDARGFTKQDIGTLAAWFASGIVAASLPMGVLIRRISAKWTLVLCLFGYALATAAFPFVTSSYVGLGLVRAFDGACSVGVWVSCETILLSRSDEVNKAFVTSIYAVSLALGYVIGPIAAKGLILALPMERIFLVSAVLATIASVWVFARLDPDGTTAGKPTAVVDETPTGVRALSLLWRAKTSCFATFSYGYFQASVVLFLPLYLIEEKHVTPERTILIPACFAFGMLVFSNVAGRIGDRVGHLAVMRVLGVVGTTMIAGFVFLDSYAAMVVAVTIAGATLASISPVSLALQGVVTDRRDYARANGIYNAFYAAGMLLGPPISSRIYQQSGGKTMLWQLVGLWTCFVVFTIVFARDDPRARPAVAAA